MRRKLVECALRVLLSVVFVGSADLLAGVESGIDARRELRGDEPASDRSSSSITAAYVAMGRRRAEAIERHGDALFDLARECGKLGLEDQGRAILERIVTLYVPQCTRRPGAAPGTESPGHGLPGPESVCDPPGDSTQEAAALPDGVRLRLRAARAELSRTAARPRATGDRRVAAEAVAWLERDALRDFVRELVSLANEAFENGFPSLAYDLVLWTLQFDPENVRLRKALRQKPWTVEPPGTTRWYGPFDYARAEEGKVDHPEFGWLTRAELERVLSGQARLGGEWISAERAASLRHRWSGRWKYETEHFEIHTNSDREQVVRFAREIERFYSFVFRTWIDFFAFDDRSEAVRLVLAGGEDLGRRKLRLHVHRSRASYLEELEQAPLLRAAGRALTRDSAGFYWARNGRAYFYAGRRGLDFRTVFHEVTHQILGETCPAGSHPPAWLAEGIAVFMESPVIRGARDAERFVVGTRLPVDFHSPLRAGGTRREVVNINRFLRELAAAERFHTGTRDEHYATAGAIVHFFLLYHGGVYRRGFIRYARDAYRNDLPDAPTPIARLYNDLAVTEDELQAAWEAFNRCPDLFDF